MNLGDGGEAGVDAADREKRGEFEEGGNRGGRGTHSRDKRGFVTHFLNNLFPIAVLHRSSTEIKLPSSLKFVEFLSISRFATVFPLSVIEAREAKGVKEEVWRKTVSRLKDLRWVIREERAMRTSLGRSRTAVGSAGGVYERDRGRGRKRKETHQRNLPSFLSSRLLPPHPTNPTQSRSPPPFPSPSPCPFSSSSPPHRSSKRPTSPD